MHYVSIMYCAILYTTSATIESTYISATLGEGCNILYRKVMQLFIRTPCREVKTLDIIYSGQHMYVYTNYFTLSWTFLMKERVTLPTKLQ